MVEFTLADGSVLTSTDHHPIWDATTTTFTDAINLRVGEDLLGANGQLLAITGERIYDQDLTAYNLQIDGIHTYYAGNTPVLVHNMCGERPPNLSPDGAGRNGAFRQAKADAGVPRSQQPSSVGPNISRTGQVQPGRTYSFEVDGEEILIREDSAGHNYGPGDLQNRGPHFNTPDGGHYDY